MRHLRLCRVKWSQGLTYQEYIYWTCPTRWTVRAESFKSILDNYTVLVELFSKSLEQIKDTEMKAKIQGIAAQMSTFDFYFGTSLALLILRHADNLSKTLQIRERHISSRGPGSQQTQPWRQFVLMMLLLPFAWMRVTATADELNVPQPALPRRRKMPRRAMTKDLPLPFLWQSRITTGPFIFGLST